MHVQVVTFGLNGITEEEYRRGCAEETGIFADLPGLLAKVWLRNAETSTYGAVYLWRDQQSYEEYVSGEVFQSIKNDPTLAGVASNAFDVFDDLTKATSPGLIVKDRAAP